MSVIGEIPVHLAAYLGDRHRNDAGKPLCFACRCVVEPTRMHCTTCVERIDREHAERDRQRAAWERENKIGVALQTMPPMWGWVDDRELFNARIGDPKLRAVAERLELTLGNVGILGAAGVGKTATMARAMRRLVYRAVDAGEQSPVLRLHWTSGLVLARARARHPLGEGEAREIKAAISAGVLVIDELGNESPSSDTWLLDVLDARYAASSVTIFTSGATEAKLRSRYGAGAWRRLTEPRSKLIDLWPPPPAGGDGA